VVWNSKSNPAALKEKEGPGSDARPHSSALVAFGIASACVCFESLRFALTGTNPDPKKAAEDGAKTIGGRLASLFVGAFCGFTALCAAQMVFLGRIVWLPFF
jgi:hypothetical protein